MATEVDSNFAEKENLTEKPMSPKPDEVIPESYSGIPQAIFVEDIDAFMTNKENHDAESVIKRLDQQHQKYKFMEMNLVARRKRVREQIPDLQKSLEVIAFLKKSKSDPKTIDVNFQMCDQVFMQASIPSTDRVCLWLGANVMLEYSLDEGEELITNNITTATDTLHQVEHDLDFIKDQLTTTEVNMARVYNWNVKTRKAAIKS